MNAAEIMEKAVERLEDHTGRCGEEVLNAYEEGSCYYTNPHDPSHHCVVGAMMPPELLEELGEMIIGIDGLTSPQKSSRLHEKFDHLIPVWMVEHRALLSDLQGVHDVNASWEGNRFVAYRELDDLCNKYAIDKKAGIGAYIQYRASRPDETRKQRDVELEMELCS